MKNTNIINRKRHCFDKEYSIGISNAVESFISLNKLTYILDIITAAQYLKKVKETKLQVWKITRRKEKGYFDVGCYTPENKRLFSVMSFQDYNKDSINLIVEDGIVLLESEIISISV